MLQMQKPLSLMLIRRIRSLAKHIISSRSELEAFFNEALEYVKQQIAIEGPDAKSITERTASGRIVGVMLVDTRQQGTPSVHSFCDPGVLLA